MKTIHLVAFGLVLLVGLNSCAPKMSFANSTIVPAATGDVKVKKDKNKNYVINVHVQNLADPKRLTPAKETYLVWMESGNESARKLGKLTPGSKALKGSLSATATAAPDNIFITAEDNADVQSPDSQIILTTKK